MRRPGASENDTENQEAEEERGAVVVVKRSRGVSGGSAWREGGRGLEETTRRRAKRTEMVRIMYNCLFAGISSIKSFTLTLPWGQVSSVLDSNSRSVSSGI